MLYKKHLLWKDLNVPYENYVHTEVKNVINTIKLNEEKYGYIPQSIEYKTPKFEGQSEDLASFSLLQILMKDFN